MKVTVHAFNYTGAHFRGFPDQTDDRPLKIIYTGTEMDICSSILNNFSYGVDEDSKDMLFLKGIVEGYQADEIPNDDGCGYMACIQDESGQVLYDPDSNFLVPGMDKNCTDWITLELDASEYVEGDTINNLVKEMYKAGMILPRPGDE